MSGPLSDSPAPPRAAPASVGRALSEWRLPEPAPPELAIILPTLNERENIAGVLARIDKALGACSWEAIIVDDNSADGTADLARAIARVEPRVRVIERIGRRGLASAAIEGMCATAAPFVAVMDADHQHDPALLLPMLAAVKSGECDLACASRFAADASAAGLPSAGRERGSRLANALARRLTGSALSDAMSGYFLMRTGQLRRQAPRLSGIGFKIMLDILASARPPLKVREFPLTFAPRTAGKSKLDQGVMVDFLAGIYERWLGAFIPTRFALFGTVGGLGVLVHLLVLALLHRGFGAAFPIAQAGATFGAMTFNFWLNNLLTYSDRRLTTPRGLLRGWLSFCAACSVGAWANVAVASLLDAHGVHWLLAAGFGIALASVWNYALSSRFVWGRFR